MYAIVTRRVASKFVTLIEGTISNESINKVYLTGFRFVQLNSPNAREFFDPNIEESR